MKDFRLGWHLPAQPLGAPLRDPVIEIDHKAVAVSSFETNGMWYDSLAEDNYGPRRAVPEKAVAPSRDVQPSPSVRQFKVGDRVRVLISRNGAPPHLNGKEGVIERVPYDYFDVRFDGEDCCWAYTTNELEHIPSEEKAA